MQSIAKRNLKLAIEKTANEYGINPMHMVSLTNTVFKMFISKMTSMNDEDIINMRHIGRFYPTMTAKMNKNRLKLISKMLEERLIKENIKYELQS